MKGTLLDYVLQNSTTSAWPKESFIEEIWTSENYMQHLGSN
jgi:hypothetical protein